MELSGINSFVGDLSVNAGIVKLDAAGSSAGAFRVNNGGMLNLNYAGAGTIGNFFTNGVALPNGYYNAASLPGFITGTGSVQVVATIPNTPVRIGYSSDGEQLSLTWPPNYQGWILQQQTNSLATGLSTNWFDVAGTANVTNVIVTNDPIFPLKFYRLRYPL